MTSTSTSFSDSVLLVPLMDISQKLPWCADLSLCTTGKRLLQNTFFAAYTLEQDAEPTQE